MKIVRNVSLFALLLIPFGLRAMQDEAAVGTVSVKSTEVICPDDIISVTKLPECASVGWREERYCATLPDGGSLCATLCLDGDVECTRLIRCPHIFDGVFDGRFDDMFFTMDARYFAILKDLYEKSQHEEKSDSSK